MDELNEEKNWFQRNWKWLVPTGCMIPILCVVCIIGMAALVFGVIRSSAVYTDALSRTQAHPEAIRLLGEPITDGWLPSGNVETTNGSGEADLEIPVSGPNGSGTLYVRATRSNGLWEYEELSLAVDGQSERIDLRGE